MYIFYLKEKPYRHLCNTLYDLRIKLRHLVISGGLSTVFVLRMFETTRNVRRVNIDIKKHLLHVHRIGRLRVVGGVAGLETIDNYLINRPWNDCIKRISGHSWIVTQTAVSSALHNRRNH
jgi:hypothetical protein